MFDRFHAFFRGEKNPLSSIKAAQAWWAAQSTADAATQLQTINEVVAEYLAEDQELRPETLQSLFWLDDMAQPAIEAVRIQYISNPRMPRETRQKLWQTSYDFADALHGAYSRFAKLESRDKQLGEPRFDMPRVIARCLRYIAAQAKWHYFRFEKAPARLWILAHQHYRLAEISGFDSHSFPLYPELSEEASSCAGEYIRMLVLATVSGNNLTVPQINLIDRWLIAWSRCVQLARKYREGLHHYYVSLQDGCGPEKVGSPSDGKVCRYWGVTALIDRIGQTLQQLENGAAPKSFDLGRDGRAFAAIELLKLLAAHWDAAIHNSQTPRAERQKVNKAAGVIHGLDRICSHVRQDNDRHRKNGAGDDKVQVDYDDLIDMRLYGFVSDRTRDKHARQCVASGHPAHDWQTWEIDNESASGLGAVLSYTDNEWVRPGILVGVQLDAKDNWQVGILRRLSRIDHDRVYTGLQILTAMPVAVTMHCEEQDRVRSMAVTELGSWGGIDPPDLRMAIYLPHKIEGSNVNTLIMRAADYGAGRIYQVKAHDKVFSVSLGRVLETGVDWIWVAVNVLRTGS